MDDLGDYRPGLQAVAELGVKSPLREAGLTKAEIRELSKRDGTFNLGKAIFCLSGFKICIRRNNQQREVDHGGKRRTVIA